MDFDLGRAIRVFLTAVFEHYFDFEGRVSRRDFWTYIAVYAVIVTVLTVGRGSAKVNFVTLAHLALFLPTASIIARRLQDTGRNGKVMVCLAMALPLLLAITGAFALIGLVSVIAASLFASLAVVPLFGLTTLPLNILGLSYFMAAVWLTVLCGQRGTPGPNAYGPNPLVTA